MLASLDPDEHLDHLARLLRKAAVLVRPHAVELYQRGSIRLRVTHSADDPDPTIQLGHEEGLAVRLAPEGAGGFSFAAASGRGEAALRCAIALALRNGPSGDSIGTAWATSPGPGLLDRERSLRLPSPSRLLRWLATSLGSLESKPPLSAWVEAAVTVESLAADGGLLASRSRSRVWALARFPVRGAAGLHEPPRVLAGRSLDELRTEDWSERPEGAEPTERQAARIGSRTSPAVFLPEAASTLVSALVRSLHGQGHECGLKVGPGWRVTDDPLEPNSLFGGHFDDTGHPTRRSILSDGKTVIATIDGEGHMRRASYRDPPVPLAANLLVEESGEAPPGHGLLVAEARIHPLEPESWALEVDGAVLRGGEACEPVRGAVFRVAPADLVRRCVAAVGARRRDPRVRVVTPSLVFDGLVARE